MEEIKCPNCGEMNDKNERFCASCGSKLDAQPAASQAQPDDSSNQPAAPAPQPTPPPAATTASATANGNSRQFVMKSNPAVSFALSPGESRTVGRTGSGAEVEIDDSSVTSTPFTVAMDDNGAVTVTDNGSSQGTRVVKLLRNDVPERKSIDVDKGDAIVAGKGLIFDVQ